MRRMGKGRRGGKKTSIVTTFHPPMGKGRKRGRGKRSR